MKITLPVLSLLAVGLALAPINAPAQSPTDAAVTYPVVHTFSGNFKSTDGNSGTFVNTVTTTSATTKSDVRVFTRSSDQETRTESTTTTINADGTRTVDLSDTDYGAATSYTAHKTLTKEKHGQFVGSGTYTTAAGVNGVLTTLETKAETVRVVSIVRTATTGTTNALRLEDDGFGFGTVKILELDPSGNLTETVTTRYITSSK